MALGTGSHWEGALLGSDASQGGLCEEVPVEVTSRRFRATSFYEFADAAEDDAGSWTTTQVGAAGTASIISGVNGGIIRLVSVGGANTGVGSWQNNQASIEASNAVTADGIVHRIISFGARMRHSDWSATNWFIGFAVFDTTLMDATGALLATACDNFVGFHHVFDATLQGGITGPDGNDLRLVSAGTAVANYQATLLSAAQRPLPVPANAAIDNVFIDVGCKITSLQDVEFYVNGTLRHRRRMGTAMVAGSQLVISGAQIEPGSNFDLDYVWASVTR